MDNMVTAPETASALGISLPAVHRLFDQFGVPANGRGRTRCVPAALLAKAIQQRGAVPVASPGRSSHQLRVLSALSRAPFGLPSARQVAERAGVSPTVASRELKTLEAEGLAAQRERVVATDRARKKTYWVTDLRTWPEGLLRVANQVVTPLPSAHADRTTKRIPKRFAHMFWNADFENLNPMMDASYIAGRMLTSPSLDAWAWVLANLPRGGVDTALTRRGVPSATRALVNNWRAHG